MKSGYVYILSNYKRTVFYVGVTADLSDRMAYHRAGIGSKFCAKYKIKYLVYLEEYESIQDAILREKQLKRWRREWKIELIRKKNPSMKKLM